MAGAGGTLGVERGQHAGPTAHHTQRAEAGESLMSGTERRRAWQKQRGREELWGTAGRDTDAEGEQAVSCGSAFDLRTKSVFF